MYRLIACTFLAFAAALFHAPAAPAREDSVRDAIVKIYTVHNSPDYYNPWNMRGPRSSTGSGCIIKGRRILTNAHVVSDQTFVQVRRNGDPRRFAARVIAVSHESDLALLEVGDEGFFEGIAPLEVGPLPETQAEVLVYGFPLGGDMLSITKGVVSRIEHRMYAHSSAYLLAGQIDAAINPGNSGGPVLEDGQVVGVVMQTMSQADNIGYMVPAPVINHFLRGSAEGRYPGFPSLGVSMQEMENPDMRRRYGMTEDQTGVLIAHVVHGSPAHGLLQADDVLLSVQGQRIANDGTVEFRKNERTSLVHLIQEKQIGESVFVEVLRQGEVLSLTIPLGQTLRDHWLIPMDAYDVRPTYYIYGGVVFCPLSKELLKGWGGNWAASAPREWVAMLRNNYRTEEYDQVVIALRVLAADINQGYHNVNNWTVTHVDGVRVRNLAHLISLVEGHADSAFVEFTNDSSQKLIFERARARASGPDILSTYRIPADRSEDLPRLSRPGPLL